MAIITAVNGCDHTLTSLVICPVHVYYGQSERNEGPCLSSSKASAAAVCPLNTSVRFYYCSVSDCLPQKKTFLGIDLLGHKMPFVILPVTHVQGLTSWMQV